MPTLFPVLHAKNMLNLNYFGVDVKRQLAQWYGHHSSVTALAAVPDGLRIASGSHDGTIILCSMVAHELSPVLDWGAHSEAIERLQFSPDGQRLASGSKFRGIRIWDAMHGTQLAILFVGDRIRDLESESDPNSFQLHRPINMVSRSPSREPAHVRIDR
ncbi:WD40-repeat-containing domain protein [Fomes fomentarius]|nr:WD40-repeat-containing domain protein [Fomes fomentarius]